MANEFAAIRVHETADGPRGRLEQITVADLNPGGLLIRVHWSGINFKDALAVTGRGKIMRHFPMVAGIDCVGEVLESDNDAFKVGDWVIGAGAGLGEERDGGFATYARLNPDHTVPLPAALSPREAIAIGTPGFTAALAIQQMEHNGQKPDLGPIAVTGPTGGVGGLAIDLLKQRGYEVVAVTHRTGQESYLSDLGADEVLVSSEQTLGQRPLEKTRWGGVIDNVGGEVLSWLTRSTVQWGNVACIGLAASHQLNTSVMPLILRGVNLLGINSVHPPHEQRLQVWSRLADDLKPSRLDALVSREISLAEVPEVVDDYVSGKNTGRSLVKLS